MVYMQYRRGATWYSVGTTWSWAGGNAGQVVSQPDETWVTHQIYKNGYGYGQNEYTWLP